MNALVHRRFWLVVLVAASSFGALPAQDGPVPPPPAPQTSHRPGYVLIDDMWVPDWVPGAESTWQATPWPGGNVHIAFSASLTESQKNWVRKAWAELEAVCGADFFEVAPGYNGDYVLVEPNPGYPNVGNSDVGVIGGEQHIHLGTGFFDADSKYGIVHELMHTLGFKHEHQRPDRDNFVTILTYNISQTECSGNPCDSNFDILGGATTTGTYDFLSIMHYRGTSFGIGDSTTILCIYPYAGFQNQLGNRKFFSLGDVNGLQAHYGQPSAPVINTVVPNAVAASTVAYLTIEVNGHNFFEGSFLSDTGVQGTRVRFNGQILDTTFVSEDQVTAVIPGSMLHVPGPYQIDVVQDVEAGGSSAGNVTFTVLPPPCTSTTDRVGQTVAGLGDVNGDGKSDYVVGIPGSGNNQGQIICYSGATGAQLWTLSGLNNGTLFGGALAAINDVNGDGKKDIIVGSPGYPGTNAGRAEIRSGANGTVLAALNNGTSNEYWGFAVAAVGDLDGDGDQEFAVSKIGYNNYTGQVQIWSANGGLMRTHNGAAAGDQFGYSISGGYDVNQDGVPDYVIGAPEKTLNGNPSTGRVYVYSGATGALLVTKDGDGAYDRFGYDVALIPTTGTAGPYGQILVGAPEIPNLFSGSGNGPGYVRLFNHSSFLNSWATLATWTGAQVGDHYGLSIASAGDINDDGYPDILIGIPQSTFLTVPVGPGGFDIRSGKSPYDLIYHYQGTSQDEQLGYAVDACGDTDGDARLDVIVGAPGSDVGCIDAGAFYVVHPPIPPEHKKVMITEVSTGDPDCVEITNFGDSSVNLNNWIVRWKDGTVHDSAPLNVTIAAGETIVVSETSNLPECPAGIQVLTVLGSVFTTTGDVAVALISNRKITVDEVHLESSTGTYTEGSLGGLFRGIVYQETSGPGAVNAERIWGLDSNSGRDWTTGGPRSMGLQNRSTGMRGSDPIPMRTVLINEIDDNLDYIELHRMPSPLGFGYSVQLQGWYLLASSVQNGVHQVLTPFPDPLTLTSGGYLVIGDSSTAPAEMPGGVPYVNLTAVAGGNIPWLTSELDCALYDSYGRLSDCLRATRNNVNLAHNNPRAPSHWSDFTGAAVRTSSGDGALGRNAISTDTNTGDDFHPKSVRTMGSANTTGTTWTPNADPQLNVVLNDNAGGGFTAIIYGGPDRAGQRWAFTVSGGHLFGAGPLLGLGNDAYANWLSLSSTLPFYGFLDGNGSARLDFPGGTLPPGLAFDALFVLQDGPTQASPITAVSYILEYDT